MLWLSPSGFGPGLGVEKIIRGHVLATVASDFAHSEEGHLRVFRQNLLRLPIRCKSNQRHYR